MITDERIQQAEEGVGPDKNAKVDCRTSKR